MNCYEEIKERVDHYKSLRSLPKILFGVDSNTKCNFD